MKIEVLEVLTFIVGLLIGAAVGAVGRARIFSRFFVQRFRKNDRLMALSARVSARKSMAEQAEFLGYADLAQRMRGLVKEDERRIGEVLMRGKTHE